MDIKHSCLIKIANNKDFYNFCRKINPLNFKELYSNFLYKMANKPNQFYNEFKGNLTSYCYSTIIMENKPNADLKRLNKMDKNTQSIEVLKDVLLENKTKENYFKLSLKKAIEQEDYWYNKRIFEYFAAGYSAHDIHKLTKNKLHIKEIYRVREILKKKTLIEYKKLCKTL